LASSLGSRQWLQWLVEQVHRDIAQGEPMRNQFVFIVPLMVPAAVFTPIVTVDVGPSQE
jgi:hypothetical protein